MEQKIFDLILVLNIFNKKIKVRNLKNISKQGFIYSYDRDTIFLNKEVSSHLNLSDFYAWSRRREEQCNGINVD